MAYQTARALRPSLNYSKVCQQCSRLVTQTLHSPFKMTSVIHQGFTDEAFNPEGKLNPWSIKKLLKLTRVMGFWHIGGPNFIDYQHLEDDYLNFLVSTTVDVEPEVYLLEKPKAPIRVETELDACNKLQMYFPNFEKPLVTQRALGVFVDVKTRHAAPAPDWWRQKYATEELKAKKPLRLQQLQVPEEFSIGVSEVEIQVKPSDVDQYCHLCSSFFARICMEAYQYNQIRESGVIDSKQLFRDVKSLAINFRGEGAIGDILKVRFWPPEKGNGDKFNFVVQKETSKIVFDAVFEFYPL